MKTIQQFFEEAKTIKPGDSIEVSCKISEWVGVLRFLIYSNNLATIFEGNTPDEAIDSYMAAVNGVKVDMDITPVIHEPEQSFVDTVDTELPSSAI